MLSEHQTLQTIEKLHKARNQTARKQIATETGVKGRSVFLSILTMTPFSCFPLDIVHLFYNVQMELLNHHMSAMNEGFA